MQDLDLNATREMLIPQGRYSDASVWQDSLQIARSAGLFAYDQWIEARRRQDHGNPKSFVIQNDGFEDDQAYVQWLDERRHLDRMLQ